MSADEITLVADKCRNGILRLGTNAPEPPRGYENVPLCAIDAVYSIGVRYKGVEGVVGRYTQYWSKRGIDADSAEHTTKDFLKEFGNAPGLAEKVFDNHQLTSTRHGIPKVQAVTELLKILGSEQFNIQTTEELKTHFGDLTLDSAIRRIHGQGSGLSAKYLFVLAGVEDAVKPDRMLIRFVSSAVDRQVSPIEAQDLVTGAAAQLRTEYPELTPRTLDHAIWNFQRQRSPQRRWRPKA